MKIKILGAKSPTNFALIIKLTKVPIEVFEDNSFEYIDEFDLDFIESPNSDDGSWYHMNTDIEVADPEQIYEICTDLISDFISSDNTVPGRYNLSANIKIGYQVDDEIAHIIRDKCVVDSARLFKIKEKKKKYSIYHIDLNDISYTYTKEFDYEFKELEEQCQNKDSDDGNYRTPNGYSLLSPYILGMNLQYEITSKRFMKELSEKYNIDDLVGHTITFDAQYDIPYQEYEKYELAEAVNKPLDQFLKIYNIEIN
jgi:hypothetical protein